MNKNHSYKLIEIKSTDTKLINKLVDIWAKSVKATHHFLREEDFTQISEYVPDALKTVEHLIVCTDKNLNPIGFLGLNAKKIEMLFILPSEFGKGIGKLMLEYAIENYSAEELCVNEDNIRAKGFYEHSGFVVCKRSNTDEQGNNYPILYMKYRGKR